MHIVSAKSKRGRNGLEIVLYLKSFFGERRKEINSLAVNFFQIKKNLDFFFLQREDTTYFLFFNLDIDFMTSYEINMTLSRVHSVCNFAISSIIL